MKTPDVVTVVPASLASPGSGFYYFADRLIAELRGLLAEPWGYSVPSVLRKVCLASGYDRSLPVWLVLRNPHDHVGGVSDDVRERVSRMNGQVFERVYPSNRKLNTADASPPRPLVIRVL